MTPRCANGQVFSVSGRHNSPKNRRSSVARISEICSARQLRHRLLEAGRRQHLGQQVRQKVQGHRGADEVGLRSDRRVSQPMIRFKSF